MTDFLTQPDSLILFHDQTTRMKMKMRKAIDIKFKFFSQFEQLKVDGSCEIQKTMIGKQIS